MNLLNGLTENCRSITTLQDRSDFLKEKDLGSMCTKSLGEIPPSEGETKRATRKFNQWKSNTDPVRGSVDKKFHDIPVELPPPPTSSNPSHHVTEHSYAKQN